MHVIFSSAIRTGESLDAPKPNNLLAFQLTPLLISKKNRSQFLRFGGGLRSQFLRFGGGLRSQFLRFGGVLRSQFLRFGGGLGSQFLRFGGGLRSQFLRFGGGLRSQFLRFGGGLRSQFLRFRGGLTSQFPRNACAGFVLRKYAGPDDLAYLNWLPISERRDFNILKLTHKAIHSSNFPEYLSLELRNVHIHNLRSSEAPLLVVPKETGTFQHSAASIFNKLPSALRNIKDYNSFCRSLKKYLSNRVKQLSVCLDIIVLIKFYLYMSLIFQIVLFLLVQIAFTVVRASLLLEYCK